MLDKIRMYDTFGRQCFYQPGEWGQNALRSGVGGGFSAYVLLMASIPGMLPIFWWFIPFVLILLPAVSVLHPLYGAPKDSSWREAWNLRHEGQYYRGLPKADKAFYPNDIIKTITDPDLSKKDAKILDSTMENLRNSIDERNRQRRLAVKSHLDITHIVEAMDESRNSIDIETNTYKELM